ncbi:hypothetical protein Taro_030846 [Colocasia esculenta]|uniref:CASP-like protein n=1 Tax=Colocasia esculenta TaxID=4460 RepID=A0A843VZ40_COLES|nr:hypothetical protein [Colocasia esculenta]
MAKTRNVFVVMLRLLALGATLCATIVMATSHESTTFFGLSLEAKFQYTPALKVLVVVNAVVAAYSLLVLFISPNSRLSHFLVTTDVLVAILLVGALAAAGSVSYVGRKGNPHAGWLPICDQVRNYCNQVMWSLICAFTGVLAYTVIAVYGIHTVVHPLLT